MTPLSLTIERHPLSAAWPEMEPDNFMALQASIAEVGVEEPVVLFEGKILDGWHRYIAWRGAIALNPAAKCPHRNFDGTLAEACAFVKRRHRRRNVTKEQQAYCEVQMDEYVREHAPGSGLERTVQQIADDAGVGTRTVVRARAVSRNAVPEVKEAFESGDISLKQAETIARLPAGEQAAAAAAPRPAPKPRGTPPPAPAEGDEAASPAGAWRAAEKKPALRPVIGASLEALDELKERNAVLTEEFDRVNDELTSWRLKGDDDERQQAHAEIAALRKELASAHNRMEALTDSRDSAVREANELMREVNKLRNLLSRQRSAA
jgi:hypothetical protein